MTARTIPVISLLCAVVRFGDGRTVHHELHRPALTPPIQCDNSPIMYQKGGTLMGEKAAKPL